MEYVPARVGYRFVAMIIDGLILSIVSVPVSFAFGILIGILQHNQGSPALLILAQLANLAASLAITIGFYGWFYRHKGATPGKLLFKMKVVKVPGGQTLSYADAGNRDIAGKFLSFITLGIGFLLPFFRKDRRALHDLTAKTQVLILKKA